MIYVPRVPFLPYFCASQSIIMRIAVNARFLLKDKLEGIGWVTHELLSRMVQAHPEHQFIFLFDRPYDESFVFAGNVTPVVVAPQARHPFLWYTWFEVSLPLVLRKYKADVFFSPDGYCSLRSKVPACMVVHDLAFEHYPRYVSKLVRNFYKHFTPRYIQHARQVIAVSEYTKQDIITQYGADAGKIQVVYNGARPEFKPLGWEERQAVKEKYTGGHEYFVYTGAIHPRKNVLNMLKAFVKFKRWNRSNMKFVLVGRMAWQTDEIKELLEHMPYREDVIMPGYLNVDELAQIIGGAYAMVYVSLFEGFGIPILEALQCQVPAVISNTSSMPEVGGDAALQCDPNDVEDIANQMNLIFKDEMLRTKLMRQCAPQAAKFNWDESAAKVWNILVQTAASGKKRKS